MTLQHDADTVNAATESDPVAELALLLRTGRGDLGLSISQAAEQLRCSWRRLHQWERARAVPEGKHRRAAERLYGIAPEVFVSAGREAALRYLAARRGGAAMRGGRGGAIDFANGFAAHDRGNAEDAV